MSAQPVKSYATLAIAIVVAALVVGASIYASSSLKTTTTITKTTTITTSTNGTSVITTTAEAPSSVQIPVSSVSVQDNSTGLKLYLYVSANTTGAIFVFTYESNMLNRVNNVTTTGKWPYPNTNSYPCGNYDQFPIEYAVMQGNWGLANYSLASSLALYNTAPIYACPTENYPQHFLSFAPLSDNASRIIMPGSWKESFSVSVKYAVPGYWTGSGTNASFHDFSPGVYTVLADDEWGNVLLLHFTVAAASAGSITTSLASVECYPGALPTNSSSSSGSRAVFNVTREFDSWNWGALSAFTVGSYKFSLLGSQNSQTVVYLEPQVFINVTSSQGQTQKTSFTNLGGWNGQVWPPDMGSQATLFGGQVNIQWLFLCDNHSVFLEVTSQ